VTRLLAPLAGLAFISLGLPDGLLGIAWPSMHRFLGVPLDALGALLIATTTGYVVSSGASGRVLRSMNLGALLAVSCALTAAGLLGYAVAPRWIVVLALAVVLGLGAGAIDAGVNTYAAMHLGPRALNWLHACFGIGAATGPVIMTAVLHAGERWQRGYVIVGVAQLALAALFGVTAGWWPPTHRAASDEHAPQASAPMRDTLRLPRAWLGVLTFFSYSGVEASMGAWTFTLLTAARHMATESAGLLVTMFWGGLTVGRLAAALAGARLRAATLLRLSVAGVVFGTALIAINEAVILTSMGVAIAGISCGPIFPLLVALTPARLGRAHAANAVGFQIATSSIGLSVLPALVGVARVQGIAHPFQSLIVEAKAPEQSGELRFERFLADVLAAARGRVALALIGVTGAVIIDVALLLDLADHGAAASVAGDQAREGEVVPAALGLLGKAAIEHALHALP
jgi:fucose permease